MRGGGIGAVASGGLRAVVLIRATRRAPRASRVKSLHNREERMRGMVLSGLVALGFGIAAGPTSACDQHQVSDRTVIASLSGQAAPLQSLPGKRLAACKDDGATCKADDDCCSGSCKPAGEARVCVPK